MNANLQTSIPYSIQYGTWLGVKLKTKSWRSHVVVVVLLLFIWETVRHIFFRVFKLDKVCKLDVLFHKNTILIWVANIGVGQKLHIKVSGKWKIFHKLIFPAKKRSYHLPYQKVEHYIAVRHLRKWSIPSSWQSDASHKHKMFSAFNFASEWPTFTKLCVDWEALKVLFHFAP